MFSSNTGIKALTRARCPFPLHNVAMFRKRLFPAAALTLGVAALSFACQPAVAQSRAMAACLPHNGFVAAVSSVTDGRTLVLTDGREVHLAAIQTPGTFARDGLPALLAGRAITISPLTEQPDRYGRIVARAFVVENGAFALWKPKFWPRALRSSEFFPHRVKRNLPVPACY
jgi:endonuclease YncB( thermonuclease family)